MQPAADTAYDFPVEHMPKIVRKRDGTTTQRFTMAKLEQAVRKAWTEVKETVDDWKVRRVVMKAASTFSDVEEANVEQIQDAVETALMQQQEFAVAKAYILYRHKRTEARKARKALDPAAIADYIHASKYARYEPSLLRREVYEETVGRVEMMHQRRFAHLPLRAEISRAFDLVRQKRLLPSMRSMQFGGKAIEVNNNRIYNCLGVETCFITAQGVKAFSDFKDGDTTTVLTHAGRWKNAVVHCYGQQQLFKLRLGRGRSSHVVRATRDHSWILEDGVRTRDLSVKMKLAKPPQLVGAWRYEDSPPDQRNYWAMGYVYGDGTLVKDGEGTYRYSMVRLCGADKTRFLDRFKELGFAHSAPPSFNGDAIAYTGHYLKTLPSIETDGLENVTAFVRGYLDADGAKNANGDWPSPFTSIQASGKKSIDFIRRVFPAVGAYVTREDDLTGEETNFGVRPETSRFGLVLGFGNSPSSPYSVQEIEADVVEMVWCLEVEDDHSFVLPNGIVTGNCAFTLVDRMTAFSEAMYLLLCGTGTGYSIQFEHVDKLPALQFIDLKKVQHHVVADTIEGWADALAALIDGYVRGIHVEFAYHLIRDAGTLLKTSGGRAPGHIKLKASLDAVRRVLHAAQGRKLRPIECHRMMCHAADAVLSGGIRRSAMIALFSLEDSEMMYAKTGDWWKDDRDPWFANANNSVALKRDEVKEKHFKRVFQMTKEFGDPGFVFVEETHYGTNPCAEIGLNPRLVIDDDVIAMMAAKHGGADLSGMKGQALTGWAFCNLCEINAAKLTSFEDFVEVARAATLIGTMQASYTSFPYLGWVSEAIADREALLGIGMTGMLDAPQIACNPEYQRAIAERIKEWNAEFATILGVRPAARTTCVKPSGTTSLELGSVGSGHHAHHARRYIRRVTADEYETVFQAFKDINPHMCVRKPDGKWVIEFPVQAPDGALIKKDLTAISFLEMVRSTQNNWVVPGTGDSTVSPGLNHNVSNTVNVADHEWSDVADYIWTHRDTFTGIALLSEDPVLPFMPFEAIVNEAQERRWNELVANYQPIDYTMIMEAEDGTNLTGEAACAGGACARV